MRKRVAEVCRFLPTLIDWLLSANLPLGALNYLPYASVSKGT